jgi:hypothetical protein
MISEQGPGRPLHSDETPTEIMQAIRSEQESLPPRLPEIPPRNRERRQLKLMAGLAIVIVAVIGVAAYEVVSGVGSKPHPAAVAAATKIRTSPAPKSAPSSASASPSLSPSPSPSQASPSPSPTASPAAVVARALKPAGVTAVGPSSGTGDDPGTADLVIDGSTSTGWQTQWYATPEFGGLKTGTGLLLDMGRTETITSVRVTLGSAAGADLQVRAGDSSVSGLKTVATEAAAGGTVQLKLASPAHARYVLIWFTKLPPDGSGTYQVEVYNVGVTGQP